MEAELRRLEKLKGPKGKYHRHPRDGPWGKTDRPGQIIAIAPLSWVVRRHEAVITDGK